MKGLIMAHETTQRHVNAANARTHYYKKQAKELKAEVKRLTELLDKATAPAPALSKDRIMFTKATIALRRKDGAYVPMHGDLYVVHENE
jgi:multidrug resistance efflux pump